MDQYFFNNFIKLEKKHKIITVFDINPRRSVTEQELNQFIIITRIQFVNF